MVVCNIRINGLTMSWDGRFGDVAGIVFAQKINRKANKLNEKKGSLNCKTDRDGWAG